MLGAEAVVHSLVEAGVSHVFGQPGIEICPLIQGLCDIAPHLPFTLARREDNACHMASGYAMQSGKAVAVMVSAGASAVISGIITAYHNQVPMVVIAGQVKELGQNHVNDSDLSGCLGNFVKERYLLQSVEEIPRVIAEAIYLSSTGRTGPVLVEIPEDLQVAELESFVYPEKLSLSAYSGTGGEKDFQIKRAVSLFQNSKQPVLCIGKGVSSFSKKIRNFAEKHNLPVVCTMTGLGVFPTDHPLFLGVLGSLGSAREVAFQESSLLLVMGADLLSYLHCKELQDLKDVIVLSPEGVTLPLPQVLPLVGQVKDVLTQFSKALTAEAVHPQHTHLQNLRKEELLAPKVCHGIHPANFFRRLGMKMNEDAVLCVDLGLQQKMASQYLYFYEKTSFITSDSVTSKGFALPCAIGAKLAKPKRQTFAVCGDGSFQRSFAELSSILSENLDIKIILFQNHVLGATYQAQKSSYGKASHTELSGEPEYLILAQAYGIPAGRITQEDEVDLALNYFLEESGTQLLIVEIGKDITEGKISDSKTTLDLLADLEREHNESQTEDVPTVETGLKITIEEEGGI
ncbi:MAG: thiamine pyrophosphate-binding protein [Eubacteriales bacterium]